MFRIAICDDETVICAGIEQVLLDYGKTCLEDIEVEVFTSGEELCHFMQKEEEFDLIFLDIELKQMNGVEVGKMIRDEMKNEIVQIVYISGKDRLPQKIPLSFTEVWKKFTVKWRNTIFSTYINPIW